VAPRDRRSEREKLPDAPRNHVSEDINFGSEIARTARPLNSSVSVYRLIKQEVVMLKTFGISALLLGSLVALGPQVASARDHDYDRDHRAWERHERHEQREWREHERWEHRHRHGYYDRYGYWHSY
jgi:hypothetical protein